MKANNISNTELRDEQNPEMMFNMTHVDLLVKIANGEIDPIALAKKQLQQRGLDTKGNWVGNKSKSTTLSQRKTRKKAMTFIEVLQSEYYYLVEAIEHGSSDPQIIKDLKQELYEKTGYRREE